MRDLSEDEIYIESLKLQRYSQNLRIISKSNNSTKNKYLNNVKNR